ncbi:MAG TPA: polysaccharide biosynthesis C-terminal domain-containing protein [Polyangia bacterium]|nr:polysaccharide biosynthesis C-terminal domain-containing protein [Polyangia bacterium]
MQKGGHRRNLALTLAANFGILGFTVVTGTLNARILGPSGRGELAAIQTIPSFLGMLALLGLPSAVGYFSARRPGEARAFTLLGVGLCLLASIPFILVGYGLLPWALQEQPSHVIGEARLYLAFIVLQSLVLPPHMALQGLGKFKLWNVLRMAPNFAALGAIALSFFSGNPSAGKFASSYLLLYAALAPLTYVALLSRAKPHASNQPTSVRAKELLRYGLPSALMIPAGLLNLQLDQMLMAAWLPSRVLGLYAVSVSWSGLLSPAFSALGSIVFPTLAAAHDRAAQRSLVGRSFRLAVILVILLGIGLALVTPLLIPLFFGKAFGPAVPTALLLVLAGMVLSLNNLSGEILRGLGAPRWPLFSQLAGLPVTVILLVVLLPRWSLVGAAVASLASYLVAGFVCIVGIRRTCDLSTRELLVPGRSDGLMILSAARGVLVRFER